MSTRLIVGLILLSGCSRTGLDGQPLGPSGGVRERDGARVDVPAGTLKTEQVIAVARVGNFPPAPAQQKFSHGVFEFTPLGQQFEGAVIVSVPAAAGDVLLQADPGGTWSGVVGATFADGTLTAAVRRFSLFAAATSTAAVERIFFSDGAALRSMDLDGGSLKTLVPGVLFDQYPTGVAIDRAAQRVYWTDNITDRVSTIGYDGSGLKVLYTSPNPLSNPTGLAVDAAHGKVFWAEGSNVRSCNLDGTQVTNVISGTSSNIPSSVALDPGTQRVYWTDNGTDTVNRADYSGANPAVLSTALDPTSNPRGLAIDVTHGRLFWAEGASIRSSGLDGSQPTTPVPGVAGTTVPDAIAVDAARRLLYWTDNGTDSVHVAPYAGTSPRVLFQNPDKFSNPQGIAVDPGLP